MWLEEVEKAFESMNCTDSERVRFASYQLQGEAYRWWKTIRRQGSADQPLSWEFFRQEFLKRYFPESLRDAKAQEFVELTQGSMTVAQYETRFEELSYFAPGLVTTEIERARRFEQGLRPNIRMGVRTHRLPTYREVVNLAKIMEQEREYMRQHGESLVQKRGRIGGARLDRTLGGRRSIDTKRGGRAP